MAKTPFPSVDAYLASQPPATRRVLERVRRIIRKAMPGAEEVISYNIPAFRLHGRTVLFFAGWKEHYSLYPTTAPVVAAFKDELAGYEVSKGTIRFPLSEPVPVTLIDGIARLRAREAAAAQAAKTAARRKRGAATDAAR
jgi:uncharacterized protein YdhG (YjbR/CyaY superfamily)